MSRQQYDLESQMNEDATFAWASKRVTPGKELTLGEYIDSICAEPEDKLKTDHGDIDDTVQRRGTKYGRFAYNSEIIQKLKEVVRVGITERQQRGVDRVESEAIGLAPFQREAIDMIMHKIGRIICGDPNHVDSWHDIAGYAVLVEKILNGENP